MHIEDFFFLFLYLERKMRLVFFFSRRNDKTKQKLQSHTSNFKRIIHKGMIQSRRAKNPKL